VAESPKSFHRKVLELTFILQDGDFGGGNALTIRGLACKASIDKPGLPDKNSAKVDVAGLSMERMEQLTTLGFGPGEMQRNLIRISAGDGETMTVIFEGEITQAWPDFNKAPDIEMRIEAESGAYPQLTPEPPVSVAGDAPVAGLIEQEARAMGYAFINEGCTASVRNAVFEGSPMEKIRKMASQVGAGLMVDDREVILLAAPDQPRSGDAVLLTKDTGMIGYPTFNKDGIQLKCLFNPDLAQGGLVKVESILPKASGVWRITKLSHELTAYRDGPWQSSVEAEYVG
jgi:hypothetical protein